MGLSHINERPSFGIAQWFLTWGKFTPGVNFNFLGGKFTES